MRMDINQTIFHLKPRLTNGRQVELIGIEHGNEEYGEDIPHADWKYMEETIPRQQARILVEGSPDPEYRTRIVPFHNIHLTEIFEHATAHKLAGIANNVLEKQLLKEEKPRIREITGFGKEDVKRIQERTERIKREKAISTERDNRKEQQKMYANRSAEDRFSVNVRSLFLTADFLNHIREKTQVNQVDLPIFGVVGAAHASQMHRFLEDPAFARRYLRQIRARIERAASEHGLDRKEVREYLNKAEAELHHWAKKAE